MVDLLHWKDAKTSGVVFTCLMVSLLSLLHFSIVSVAAHVALLLLCGTISLRVYRKVLQAVHRGDGANPFPVRSPGPAPHPLSLSRPQS